MRLVFAGTPDAAVPSLRALLDSPRARGRRGGDPAGRAGRVEAGRTTVRRSASSPTSTASRCSTPRKAGDPEFLDRLRELAPDCCPVVAYGALLPEPRAGRPAPRLGEPALLAAAGLARRRPGAGRDPARRRDHRRVDLPDRGGTGRRSGVRHGHRGGRPRPTPPATCSSGSPSPAPTAGRHPGRHRGRTLRARAAAGRRRLSYAAEDHRGRRPFDWTAPGAGAWTGWCARSRRNPARWTVFRASGSSSARSCRSRDVDLRRPASCWSSASGCWSARPPARWRWARCRPQASSGCPRPTGRAVPGSNRGSGSS